MKVSASCKVVPEVQVRNTNRVQCDVFPHCKPKERESKPAIMFCACVDQVSRFCKAAPASLDVAALPSLPEDLLPQMTEHRVSYCVKASVIEFALQANLAVIERFGKFQRIAEPGEHAQMPLGGAAAAAVQLHRIRQSLIGRHHACCCKQLC